MNTGLLFNGPWQMLAVRHVQSGMHLITPLTRFKDPTRPTVRGIVSGWKGSSSSHLHVVLSPRWCSTGPGYIFQLRELARPAIITVGVLPRFPPIYLALLMLSCMT